MSELAQLKTALPVAADAGRVGWTATPVVRLSIGLHLFVVAAAVASPAWWPWLLAAFLGNHLLLGALVMAPHSQLLGANLATLPRSGSGAGCVALTFDDGPDPDVTPLVLDLLDRHGATASFFCVGRRAAAHPEIVRDIVRRGHSVENHSDRHPFTFACFPSHALHREISNAQAVLGSITGHPPLFFRAPMGLRSPLLDPVLARSALRHVSWTRRGWDCVCANPASVLRRVTSRLAAGDVILLHDGSCARTRAGEPIVLAVLPALLAHLGSRGLRPVSLPIALALSSLSRSDPIPRPPRTMPRSMTNRAASGLGSLTRRA
jgi:peptidoglycan/xylan/chitin deacetylase (PgdA/CDA1 family)